MVFSKSLRKTPVNVPHEPRVQRTIRVSHSLNRSINAMAAAGARTLPS
jgi:hypothetical protein